MVAGLTVVETYGPDGVGVNVRFPSGVGVAVDGSGGVGVAVA